MAGGPRFRARPGPQPIQVDAEVTWAFRPSSRDADIGRVRVRLPTHPRRHHRQCTTEHTDLVEAWWQTSNRLMSLTGGGSACVKLTSENPGLRSRSQL